MIENLDPLANQRNDDNADLLEMHNQIKDMTATKEAPQAQIDTKPTFAEKTKVGAAVPAQAATKTALVDKPVIRDLSKIQNYYLKKHCSYQKKLCSRFPLKRLVLSFHAVRGNILLEFFTKNEAEEVLFSWKSNFFGSETLFKKAVDPEKPNFSLLTKGVPTELEDSWRLISKA